MSARTVALFTLPIVAICSGLSCKAAPGAPEGVLLRISIVPNVAVLSPGQTRQFTTSFEWSDSASNTNPPVAFALLGGGTVSQSGLYSAPVSEDTSRVIVALLDGRLSDTAEVVVASAQTPLYPNQPVGLTRFAENDFSGIPAFAGQPGTIDGNFQTLRSPSTRIITTTDSTAPQSPPGVLQIDFAAGTEPGYSTPPNSGYRLFTGWDGPDNLSNTEYSEIYESLRFKVVGNDFQTQSTGVKMLGYWGVANNNGNPATAAGPVEFYHLFANGHEGGPGTSVETRWNITGYTQGVNSLAFPQNRNLLKRAEAGRWHQFELYAKLNSIGQANGIWRWWLDGVLIGEYTDMIFITATKPSGFYGRTYDAVWGGQGGTARTRNDYLWLDHLYQSGVFLRNGAP